MPGRQANVYLKCVAPHPPIFIPYRRAAARAHIMRTRAVTGNFHCVCLPMKRRLGVRSKIIESGDCRGAFQFGGKNRRASVTKH